MSDDVEKHEDNVHPRRREWDCNSSSGGSVYQEFHGRQEEIMYSTDDEFMDATETIRAPLLSDDPEQQLSSPVLKQLRQEKEQTRYIVVDMVTDCESVNNVMEQCKHNMDTIVEQPCGQTDTEYNKRNPLGSHSSGINESDQRTEVGQKAEKNKYCRSLRLPSSVALPNVKSDRPARGDGRPPFGVSKIPLSVSKTTLQQISTTPEQNSSETESCQTNPSKQPGSSRKSCIPKGVPAKDKQTKDIVPECLNKIDPPKDCLIKEASGNLSFGPQELTISKDEKPQTPEKPRSKRARSLNKSIRNEPDTFSSIDSPVSSTNEEAETKRMRVAKRTPSREEPENRSAKPSEPAGRDPDKRKREIQAVRQRLAKDRLNLINSRERDAESKDRQNQMVDDSNGEQKIQDSLKRDSIQKSPSRKSDNATSQSASKMRASPSNPGSEKNTEVQEKVPSSSPRNLSPIVINMSIVEKRRQLRQSRESINTNQKLSTKNANMPEIKPLLFKPNQLKTNQLGQRHQENTANVPMKTGVEDESLKKKTTLVEKRKMMMKQKEAGNNANKSATNDALLQRPAKGLERSSREKPPLVANQKQCNSDNRKPSPGIPKHTERPTNLQASITIQDVQEDLEGTDVQAKSLNTSTNAKVSLASMQNVYKIHYKRCEENFTEVKRAKDKLGMSLEKLETLRSQIIQKFGEETEELVPTLYVVQNVELNSPTVMTTAKGMNTEVLEEVAESLVLLGNNQQLKYDIENLRMQLEEAKEIGYANKREDDVISDLRQRICEMSLTLTLAEKRQQTLEDKMEEKKKEILSLSNENKQINDLYKQREQQLSALRKQIDEKNRELENVQKKLAEATKNLQEESFKRELSHIEYEKLIEEKNEIEKELQEMDTRFADFEEREECLNTILENEKKKNKKLEELLSKKENELSLMEKKFYEMETSSSNSLMIVNEQLQEKNSLIKELEMLKTTLQSQIRELCCLVCDMFALRGIVYNSDHIQRSLSCGSLPQIRDELLKMMEERIEEDNKAFNEAKAKIDELQNQVKILHIELEDSKMMSERLTNVITHQKPWDTERPWEEHQSPWSSDMTSAIHGHIIENSARDNGSFRDGDTQCLMPSINNSFVCSDAAMARNNFHELFVLLERKRRQLLQLERKYQDMEEVHSHCAQKRTRNETRIAQLEMMLA